MKKFIVTIAIVTSLSYGGKNVAPPPSKPIPIPVPLGLYFGGGFTYAHSKCTCAPLTTTTGTLKTTHKGNTKGINLKVGYDFNPYVGVEVKYLYTPWGDKDKTLKHYGIYLKPSYPISEQIDIYALLGYGKTDCETLTKSEKGFAWGVGVSYNFGKRIAGKKEGLGVYLEYLRPLHKTGSKKITVDTVSTGLQYNF